MLIRAKTVSSSEA